MKHQEVSVDFWAMGKAMVTYGVITVLVWMMLRLFNMVFTLPGRLRAQQNNLQDTLKELQRRYPDLNITEEDLVNAEKELEELTKEADDKHKDTADKKENPGEPVNKAIEEDKKTI